MFENDAAAADPLKLGFEALNDLGNAQRLMAREKGRLIMVTGVGWHAFTGILWDRESGDHLAMLAAHRVAEGLRDEARAMEAHAAKMREKGETEVAKKTEGRASDLIGWATASGNAGKTKAMLEQASAYLAVSRDELDQDRTALNTPSGLITFRVSTGDVVETRCLPHDPRHMVTRVTSADYDERAKAEEWERHLARVLPDPEERRYFQTWMGYCCVGGNPAQRFLILQGRGGDGKSTSMNVIRRVLGSYAYAADVKTFLEGGQKSGADASPDLARLAGDVRLCSVGEPNRGAKLNEGLLKAITGGAPLLTRELNKAPVESVPGYKIVMECNPLPIVRGADDGIWRRVDLIQFPVQLAPEEMDTGLEDRLVEKEGPGILNWLIEGLKIYLLEGLIRPDPVREAVSEYRAASNPFGEWLAERVAFDGGYSTAGTTLYNDYEVWCSHNEHEPESQKSFGLKLNDRQIRNVKDRLGRKVRKGVRLLPSPPEWSDAALNRGFGRDD